MNNIDVSILETKAALWVALCLVAIIVYFIIARVFRQRNHEYKHSRALKIRCFRDNVVLLMQKGICDDPAKKYYEVESYCTEHEVTDAELGISLAELLNYAVSNQFLETRKIENQFDKDCSRHRFSLPQYGQCNAREWAAAVIDLAPVIQLELIRCEDALNEHKRIIDYQAKKQGLVTGVISHPLPVTQAQPLFD